MKDIRALYQSAKFGALETDINAYKEAVQDLLANRPSDYVLQLEYIISSDIGISTLNQFIEKYGICIPVCDYIIECVDVCIEKCDKSNLESQGKKYKELKDKVVDFKEKYSNCLTMFDYYQDDSKLKEYIESFYSYTNGIQNKYIPGYMMNHYGEMAVPDILITSNEISESAIMTTLNTIYNSELMSPTFTESLVHSFDDLDNLNEYRESVTKYFSKDTLTTRINEFSSRVNNEYREAVIMGEYDRQIPVYESDIAAIHDAIDLAELAINNIPDTDKVLEAYNHTMELYSLLDGIVMENGDLINEDVADSVIPMLPYSRNGKVYTTEGNNYWTGSNHDAGKVPGYLSKHHDLNIGEEEEEEDKKKTDKSDYERHTKSTDTDYDNDEGIDISQYRNDDKWDDVDDLSPSEQKAVNNYYYYTYTNSLNRNLNSYNRGGDYSKHDSHDRYDNSNHHNVTNASDDKVEESVYSEAKDDKNDGRPESDHPVRDAMMDIDRKTAEVGAKVKKGAKTVTQGVKAATKPVKRIDRWLTSAVQKWQNKSEDKIKEEMADPHHRKNLYGIIKSAIVNGSLMKAGLLLNPIFLAMKLYKHQNKDRLRTEMIGELKTEMEIIDEKIRDCPYTPEGRRAKYKLMRFKNELNKKLMRVGGTKGWSKWI